MEERHKLIPNLLSNPHNAKKIQEWRANREEMNQASAAASMDTELYLKSLSPAEFEDMISKTNIKLYPVPTLKRSSRNEGLELKVPVDLNEDCDLERQTDDDVNENNNTCSGKRIDLRNLENQKLLELVEQTVGKTTPVKDLEKSEGLLVNSEASEIHLDSLSMDSGRTSDNNSSTSSVNIQYPSISRQLQQPLTSILTEGGRPFEQEGMSGTSNTTTSLTTGIIGSQLERGCHSSYHNQIQFYQYTIQTLLEMLQTEQNRNQPQICRNFQHGTDYNKFRIQNVAMGKKIASMQMDHARLLGSLQNLAEKLAEKEDEVENLKAAVQHFLQVNVDRRKENEQLKKEGNSLRERIYKSAEKFEGVSVKIKENTKKTKKVQEEKLQSEHKYSELLKENELLKKKNSFLEKKVKKQEKKDQQIEETEFSADEKDINKRIEEVVNELRDLNEQLESPWFGSSDTEERSHEKKSEPDQE